jgi:hypothetical protein
MSPTVKGRGGAVSLSPGGVTIVVAVIGALGLILQAMIQRRGSSAAARDTPAPASNLHVVRRHQPSAPPRIRPGFSLYSVAAVAVVIGFVAGSLVAQSIVSSRLKAPSVRISTPRDGAVNQPNVISVHGTYTHLRKGQQIWGASRSAPKPSDKGFDLDPYFPEHYSYHRPCSTDQRGSFECPLVQLGREQDKGKTFEVLVLIGDAPCCIGPLPRGTVIGDVIKVTRSRT